MRLEAEIQMTKTNCNLIHFEESYFSKSREAFICSQAARGTRAWVRKRVMIQTVALGANHQCLGF